MDEPYQILEAPGATPAAPLLLLFHGTGGDEYQFFGLAEHLLAGAYRVAIRGDVSEHGARRYFKRLGAGLYDMEDLAFRTAKMAAFIERKVTALRPSAVLGFGYSNGANILASVLFAAPQLFDAAALLHPLIPFEPPAQPGLAGRHILVTAGRTDPICPPAQSLRLAEYFSAQGAALTLFWHAGGHELRDEEVQSAARFLRQVRPDSR